MIVFRYALDKIIVEVFKKIKGGGMKIIFPEAGNGETSLCLPTLNTVKRIFGGLICLILSFLTIV